MRQKLRTQEKSPILETTRVPSASAPAESSPDQHREIDPGKEAQAVQNEPDYEAKERLAYKFWLERGCPIGSPEDDWFRAEEEFRQEASIRLSTVAMGPDTSL